MPEADALEPSRPSPATFPSAGEKRNFSVHLDPEGLPGRGARSKCCSIRAQSWACSAKAEVVCVLAARPRAVALAAGRWPAALPAHELSSRGQSLAPVGGHHLGAMSLAGLNSVASPPVQQAWRQEGSGHPYKGNVAVLGSPSSALQLCAHHVRCGSWRRWGSLVLVAGNAACRASNTTATGPRDAQE